MLARISIKGFLPLRTYTFRTCDARNVIPPWNKTLTAPSITGTYPAYLFLYFPVRPLSGKWPTPPALPQYLLEMAA